MNRQYLVFPILSIFLISGCAKKTAQQQLIVHETSQAESLMQSGQHKQAARLYQSLANSKSNQTEQFRLLAAEAFLQSGDSLAAQTHISTINPKALSIELQNKLKLIQAQINLSNGEAEHALNKLSLIQPHYLNQTDLTTFYQSQAFAQSLTGNVLQSVQARIQLSPLLDSQEKTFQNNQVILDNLNLLPNHILSQYEIPAPNVLGGWIALSKILKSSGFNQSPAEFYALLNQWQQTYPQHPANSDFLLSFLEGPKNSFVQASRIAVLLPQSGRYAHAAKVIKKGFMAAYHHSNTGSQPSIRFYDSSSDSPTNLYHLAIAEGAELVIGPLAKNNIQSLALATELSTPVLALNHIQNLAKDNLFQFGLSPIDVSRQLAMIAGGKSHKKALLLTPNNKKGQRIANHLTESWLENGGTILESQTYNTRESDFSQPIKNLLNLNESKFRYKKLRAFLSRNLEFNEHRRHDADAILLSASAQSARSIYPQLRFYRASGIPVFATNEIFTGLTNSSLDIDLNTVTFCDIPWLFNETYPGALSQNSLREIWQTEPNKYLRLVALGIDAFNIVDHLGQLSSTPYHGATGLLSINMENRITRQLVCAKFDQGKAVLQNFAQLNGTNTQQDDLGSFDYTNE